MHNVTNRPRSMVLPAYIIAMGMVVAAAIIAKPKVPFHITSIFPPVSTGSVQQQFMAQMQRQLAGRQVTIASGEKVTLAELEVESVSYNAESNEYSIRYDLHWNNRSQGVLGTGCFLPFSGSNSFSGACNTGEEHVRNGSVQPQTVTISVR